MDAQTEWSRLFMNSLARAGVQEVVTSPGSRSTPVLLAALACPALRCHSVIDERSAGFLALGLVRASARPVALLCTSGSAAAHYYPAVLEASEDRLPLVVLSADRPATLHGWGANQTLDQQQLFGRHVRAFVDLGPPEGSLTALRSLRRRAHQAVITSSLAGDAGPVHINVPLSKPLEPGPARSSEDRAFEALAREVSDEPWPRVSLGSGAVRVVPELLHACKKSQRGLIVLGCENPLRDASELILQLSDQTGFAVASDAGHPLRYRAPRACTGLNALFTHPEQHACLAPDLILQLGRAPVGGGWNGFLEGYTGARWVFSERVWHDPWGNARGFVLGPLALTLGALMQALPVAEQRAERSVYLAQLVEYSAWFERQLETLAPRDLAPSGGRYAGLSELSAVRAVVTALPSDSNLVLGNSLVVRHVTDWAGTARDSQLLHVFTQRGTSGIEGMVAGAVGAALGTGRPTLTLLGDVSMAHDLGSLNLLAEVRVPFVLVVVNNAGGRIFEQLAVARAAPEALRFFLTPPNLALEAAAELAGCRFRRPADPAALQADVRQGLSRSGPTLIEVVVPPSGAAEQAAALASLTRRYQPHGSPPSA